MPLLLHADPVPLPSDAGYLIDADAGRIVLSASSGDLVVLAADGTVTSRLPFRSQIQNPRSWVSQAAAFGSVAGLVGTISGDTLRVYDADGGVLRHAIALSHASGEAAASCDQRRPRRLRDRHRSPPPALAGRARRKPSRSPARPAQSELS